MRRKILSSTLSAVLAISGCSALNSERKSASPGAHDTSVSKGSAESMHPANNFLLRPSSLDYFTPEFDKVDTALYEPAFELGLTEHREEVDAIARNPEPASFANTIVAMEQAGELLNRATILFYGLSSLVSDDEYQRIEAKYAPILSQHNDDIYLNPALFARVQALHETRNRFSGEDRRLIDVYYKQFVRAGAQLGDEDKARMREINANLSTLSTKFSQNVLAAYKDEIIVVTDKTQLDGLSEEDIASLADAAAKAGTQGYAITLVNTTRQPILQSLSNRALRQQVWQASAQRAGNNSKLVLATVKLRAEKANLLGYPSWAAYVLDDQMARTPDEVYKILDDLAPKALARAKVEAADIEALMRAEDPNMQLQPWDWAYYAERVRQAKFDIDEQRVKPYFEMDRVVRDGLFFAMNKLYGITLQARPDLPVWHPDVQAYEVFNDDGSAVGLFYLDPYAREGKRGGAWMNELVTQSKLKNTKPVVYNVLNIPKPAAGQPTLMTFREVSTLFHEFGHAVHGLFSEVTYPSVAGTATARDFVEFPSQFHEDWMLDPMVLANYAKHFETDEPIPAELLAKVLAAQTFNQGFDSTEYLAAALLDMEWHSLPFGDGVAEVASFEQRALASHQLDYAPVPPRYKSNYFSHIFDGGYSAGYYAYLWTEVLAADAFAYLQSAGGMTRANGDRYRELILARGNSRDLMQNYIDFRGQKPSIDALLVRRGLVAEKVP